MLSRKGLGLCAGYNLTYLIHVIHKTFNASAEDYQLQITDILHKNRFNIIGDNSDIISITPIDFETNNTQKLKTGVIDAELKIYLVK